MSKISNYVRLLFVVVMCVSLCTPVGRAQQCISATRVMEMLDVSPYASRLRPRRLLIVTTENRQDRLKEQDVFAKSIARHLKQGRMFEVVVARDRVCSGKLPMNSGKFDERALIEFRRQYNVDTVLFCEVVEMDAYHPMRSEVSLLLVSINEAIALISGAAVFDLRDAQLEREFLDFALRGPIEGPPDVMRHSPTRFLDFTSHVTALGLLNLWNAEPSDENVLRSASNPDEKQEVK